jgi:tetratricopeptide (TPR) repeat protein
MPHDPDAVSSLGTRARDLLDAGDPQGALPIFAEAISMAELPGDGAELSGLLGDMAVAYRRVGNIETAIDVNRRAIDVARARGDDLDVSLWCGNLGGIFYSLPDLDAAEACFREAMEAAGRAGSAEQISIAGSHLAGMMGERGRFSEAAEIMAAARARAAVKSDVASIVRELQLDLHLRWANSLREERRLREMREVIERALTGYGEGPRSRTEVTLLLLLADSCENGGDITGARAAIRRAADASEAIGETDNAQEFRALERRMKS